MCLPAIDLQQGCFKAGRVLDGHDSLVTRAPTVVVRPMLVGINENRVGIVCTLASQLNCQIECPRTSVPARAPMLQDRATVSRKKEVTHQPRKLILSIAFADKQNGVVSSTHDYNRGTAP